MGRLTRSTINNYMSRLRKLRKVFAVLPDTDERKPQLAAQIERLTNQLGKEMTDLEIALARGPGRPRENADVSNVIVPQNEKPKTAFTQEDLEKRYKELVKKKAEGEVTTETVEKSNDDLINLMKEALNEGSE